MSVGIQTTTSHIRPLRIPHDLRAVADLIDICFSPTMDPDGREYLRRLRAWAREAERQKGPPSAIPHPGPHHGFVYEQEGRIIGNLNLVFPSRQRQRALIVNVAVHPDYQHQGIGRALTEMALAHLRSWGYTMACLQVRDDNPAAIHLYQSLGFQERTRRTLWLIEPNAPPMPATTEGIKIRPRKRRDWPYQQQWLRRVYPEEVAWNLPLDIPRMSPGVLAVLRNIMEGSPFIHRSAYRGGELIGVCTWEPTSYYADWLWLAPHPQWQDQALLALLPAMYQWVGRRRPLSVNFPAGQAETVFKKCGFSPLHTLIWMELPL